MTYRFDCSPIKTSLLPAFLLALLFCPPLFADIIGINKQIALHEDDFRSLSSEFYRKASARPDENLTIITDIDQLQAEVNRLLENQLSTRAILLLHLNVDTITDNLDHKAVFEFTELLLENNAWQLASTLLDTIQNEGDRYLLATIQFIFAKYYASRNEWDQVSRLLDGMFNELSREDVEYAYLLHGVALQNLKKHRQAIESFKKVPGSSQYYAYAQLNIAVANIRQGWWTDAHTTIANVIDFTDKDNNDEVINRLYLILGYSLLQKEFYRDARNAFRHIGLDSRYTNRALLGIGLTATSQGDFVGGLNALSILNEKQSYDLSVDESYLLIPYVYEKLEQEVTATASYNDAINYYQQRLDALNKIANKRIDFSAVQFHDQANSMVIQSNDLNYGKIYPESFFNNYRILIDLSRAGHNTGLEPEVKKLLARYDTMFQEIIGVLLNQRKEYIKSYLNQSRYGLARLYDKSNEGAE